jgi:hypothetical protein
MIKAAFSTNPTNGCEREQPDMPTVDYFEILGINRELDWSNEPYQHGFAVQGRRALLTAKAGDELTMAMRRQVKTELSRRRKIIARMADDDLRRDIEATIAATKLMQDELDRRAAATRNSTVVEHGTRTPQPANATT